MIRRLIEKWLPIAALGEESVRERRSMTALPPIYYLHVWWARRPLVASRAAVLASLLPEDADQETFLHVLGIHGDPVAVRRKIDQAKKTGENLGANVYGYPRAFTYNATAEDMGWLQYEVKRVSSGRAVVLDPTAGGGSIPFETGRLGFDCFVNDLNPVAALILKQTIEAPTKHGRDVVRAYEDISQRFIQKAEPRYEGLFPPEANGNKVDGYLWARTITCPYCDGVIPLSPNWRLAPDGTGVRLTANPQTRRCTFTIVKSAKEHSPGTLARGDAQCPYPDCGRVTDQETVRQQSRDGLMGEQLFAVVYKERIFVTTKTGRQREKWIRGYRSPHPKDDNAEHIKDRLNEKLPEWEALDIVPTETIGPQHPKYRLDRYGVLKWQQVFSPRQLLCHGTSVEVFRELLDEERQAGRLDEATRAAFVYLSFALDKLLNYNSRMSIWMPTREVVANTFNRHDFAFCWTHAEMAPLITGLGYDWAIEQTGKALRELIELTRPGTITKPSKKKDISDDLFKPRAADTPEVVITCASGDSLHHIDSGTVDAVVMDPPYYDNVMYAELSDFFYVWLKRTAGYVYPELFKRKLTDKESEAVANPAKFDGQKGATKLAEKDYQQRMAGIFTECRRVLKDDGILTLMFTHKATGAWDALASGLLEAGFTITASWPINTEAEGSLHIRDKAAAKSTVFLVCRPRPARDGEGDSSYWEDVEPLVARAVRSRIEEFQEAGIGGVDLYLSCFGPALEELARHWPLTRGTPRTMPEAKGRRKKAINDAAAIDPYAVTPEDALDAARREVKAWRMQKLLRTTRRTELDGATEWFVLAWDAFRAPRFPYDEALRLARVVGVDLDREIVKRLAEKKGSDLVLWDSARRAAKGALGSADGGRSMLDALHHAAFRARTQGLEAGGELLEASGAAKDPAFTTALAAVLEVLPVSSTFTGFTHEKGPVGEAAGDFDALEHLRRLAFSDRVGAPQQLKLWTDAD